MWSIDDNDTTVLTGMPSGTWFVRVYHGFTDGSSISSVGIGTTTISALFGVPNGGHVDIEICSQFGFTIRQPVGPIWKPSGFTAVN